MHIGPKTQIAICAFNKVCSLQIGQIRLSTNLKWISGVPEVPWLFESCLDEQKTESELQNKLI